MENPRQEIYRAGFVSVVGRPNVGKSTLINGFVEQKIAAVSPRPQTTRRRQLGILTLDNAQIVFVDTPGLHRPIHKLGDYMNQTAADTLEDADVVLWLADTSAPPNAEDHLVAERLATVQQRGQIFLVMNKIDLVSPTLLAERQAAYQALLPEARLFLLSAATGQNRADLLQAILALLPEGQPFYDVEQITDLYERDIAADLIREAALVHLREEVPHSIAVRIDEYKERGDTGAFIRATLFVEKESQKGIVIGKAGDMLKKIGAAARKEIETLTARKVFLELNVKVNKNWRDSGDALRLFGYAQPEEDE